MYFSKKARIEYLDQARGIGIIAVIIGHIASGCTKQIIYSFHMPLFFLIGGMFISDKYSVNQYIKRKARELLIPYYVTCGVMCILAVLCEMVNGSDIYAIRSTIREWILASLYASGSIEPFGIKHIGAIWFLWAMFFALCLVRIIISTKYPIIILLVCVSWGLISSQYIWLPLSIQAGFVATAFVYTGYYISKNNFSFQNYFTLVLVEITLWVTSIIFCHINMSSNDYSFFPFNYLGGISGSFLVIYILKKMTERKYFTRVCRVLSILGRNSLAILCLHIIEQNLFPWSLFRAFLKGVGLNSWIIISVCLLIKFCWAIGGIMIMRQIKILRKLFAMI